MRTLFFPMEWWLQPLNLQRDQLQKRVYVLYVVLILGPLSTYLGVIDFAANGWTLISILCFLGGLSCAILAIMLRYLHREQSSLRFALAFMLLMISTTLAVGGADGVGHCWYYIYPLVAYYVFGQKEGSLWVAISWASALAFGLFNLGPHHYPTAIGARFVFSYIQVSFMAYGMEYSRIHYYNRLMAEKRKVETTLHEIYTLQALLPICINCKNVRDDGGYWHQVESYMTEHTGIEFSHGICPDCRSELYKSMNSAKIRKLAS